jgi:heterodisulfide reductase subunit C
MRINISKKRTEGDFVDRVEKISGQNLLSCYQCGKCTAGCPIVSEMDLTPSQVIRYSQLGIDEDLMESKAIWLCASSMTCNVRCPKGVKIAEIFEALRLLLLRKGKDHLDINAIPKETLAELPPIALISSMRKFTA